MWSSFTKVLASNDYYFTLQHPYTGSVLATSEVFTFIPNNIQLSITSPTSDSLQTFFSGENVTISWNCSGGSKIAVFLYLDRNNTAEKIATISPGMDTSKAKTTNWTVRVTEESSDYYFVIQETTSSDSASSQKFHMVPPDMTVTLKSERNEGILIRGETVLINWAYVGYPAQMTILFIDASNEGNFTLIDTISSAPSGNYSWTVPTNLESGKHFYITITSAWYSTAGSTSPFIIAAPGQISNPTYVLAIIYIVLVILVITVIMILYLKFLKEKKLGAEAIN